LTNDTSGSELAINITDGKLFYKDNSGTVQVLATKGAGTIGGSNTQMQYNSSGTLAGSANLTFDGTTLTANALTTTSTVTINGGTANGVAYLNGSKVLTTGSALVFDGTNLGLGATPSAWGVYKALQVNTTGVFSNVSGTTRIGDNFYYDGSNYRYLTNSYASMEQYNGGAGGFSWFNAPSGTAGNAITWQNLMQLTMPSTGLTTLTVGQGGTASNRNTIVMTPGGYSNQPGNQTTDSSGDKFVLYASVNRTAMGIGTDFNWWSQSKSFEWWISPTNSSTTVTKQLTLNQTGLFFGASSDNTPRYIAVNYSSVPTYLSSSFDGTYGVSTLSSNTWNNSNGSISWSSFANSTYTSAALQLVTGSTNSYVQWYGAVAANTVPTVGGILDNYGIIAGTSSYSRTSNVGPTPFANLLSQANLGSIRNTYFEGDSSNGGSNWYGLGKTPAYSCDWNANYQSRWVNNSGTWAMTHEVSRNTGLESELFNPAFLYEVATGSTFSGPAWQLVYYNVSGGTATLSRNSVGYDSSNKFTAPQTGWYHFSAQINFSSSNDTDGTIKLIINGNTSCYGPSSSALAGSMYPGCRQVSGTMYLNSGDYVQVYIYVNGTTNVVRGSQPYSGSFSGHFVA
jgi:hypothetical protein